MIDISDFFSQPADALKNTVSLKALEKRIPASLNEDAEIPIDILVEQARDAYNLNFTIYKQPEEMGMLPFYEPMMNAVFVREELLGDTSYAALVQVAHVLSHVMQFHRGDFSLDALQAVYRNSRFTQQLESWLFWPLLVTVIYIIVYIYVPSLKDGWLSSLFLPAILLMLLAGIPFILLRLWDKLLNITWLPLHYKMEHQAGKITLEMLRKAGILSEGEARDTAARFFLTSYATLRFEREPCVRELPAR